MRKKEEEPERVRIEGLQTIMWVPGRQCLSCARSQNQCLICDRSNSDTGLVVELEHHKTKTRLIDEKFASVRGECETSM
jgi:hypothetical protein